MLNRCSLSGSFNTPLGLGVLKNCGFFVSGVVTILQSSIGMITGFTQPTIIMSNSERLKIVKISALGVARLSFFGGLGLCLVPAFAAPTFINALEVSGNASDKSGLPTSFEQRLSFGSDLVYDRATGSYYGLADRGPGGGVLPYETRLQQFGLTVNATSGAISNFNLTRTVLFKDGSGNPLNGLNPSLLPGGNANTLGRSFDPEGLVRMGNVS
jgi:hypothetical protein